MNYSFYSTHLLDQFWNGTRKWTVSICFHLELQNISALKLTCFIKFSPSQDTGIFIVFCRIISTNRAVSVARQFNVRTALINSKLNLQTQLCQEMIVNRIYSKALSTIASYEIIRSYHLECQRDILKSRLLLRAQLILGQRQRTMENWKTLVISGTNWALGVCRSVYCSLCLWVFKWRTWIQEWFMSPCGTRTWMMQQCFGKCL